MDKATIPEVASRKLSAVWGWALFAFGLVFFFSCQVISPWPLVYSESGVRLLELDGYYHVRHAVALQQHFPHLSRYDVGTHYPTGERGINQGLHDLLLAIAGQLNGGGLEATISAGAWLPIPLAFLTLTALFALVSRLAEVWVGGLAVALVSLYPAHLTIYKSLGNADHHSTEVLLSLLVLLGACHLVTAEDGKHPAIFEALPLVLFQFTWFGAPLHLAAVGLAWGVLVSVQAAAGQPARLVLA